MEQWGKDARREPVITDLDALVAKDHLLRKIERVMDYSELWTTNGCIRGCRRIIATTTADREQTR